MKKTTLPHANKGYLGLQRFLYFFQVLGVGVAIPFLFLYGISSPKLKTTENQIEKVIGSEPAGTPTHIYIYTDHNM